MASTADSASVLALSRSWAPNPSREDVDVTRFLALGLSFWLPGGAEAGKPAGRTNSKHYPVAHITVRQGSTRGTRAGICLPFGVDAGVPAGHGSSMHAKRSRWCAQRRHVP
jgi:hypothetical protein